MNWYKNIIKISSVIGYHATRADFDTFDLSFAKDELGMQMGEGYGHNKFYFAKEKDHAWPQQGSEQVKLITAELDFQDPISGEEYLNRLRNYIKKGMSRPNAVDKLDAELISSGYDAIMDGWQIAVFHPIQIKIINVEKIN